MMNFGRTLALLWVIVLGVPGCAGHRQPPLESAVASSHPLATQAALRTLDNGGNAFDAAITAAAVLAVVDPYSAGLGGGGFWLLQRANGELITLNTGDGLPKTRASLSNPTPPAIPGQPAVLAYLSERFAERPFRSNLAEAVRLARSGTIVEPRHEMPATDTQPGPARTALIRQEALATTLEQLALQGNPGFYEGPVAQALVNDFRAAGVILSKAALTSYELEKEAPLVFHFGSARLITVPSPGGIALAQMFGILAANPLPQANLSERNHHLAEVMRRAYRDQLHRPDSQVFTGSRQDRLLAPEYLQNLAADIDPLHATPSGGADSSSDASEDRPMAHLSIVDPEGNKVSATLSGTFVSRPGGSGVISTGTGVLLNMAVDPLAHRSPGSHPLADMAPAILETEQRTTIIGSSGGNRIASALLHGLLDSLQGRDPHAIVQAPRFHHPYLPDEIQVETGVFSAEEIFELETLGHHVTEIAPYGEVQIILIEHPSGTRKAAADPRGHGQAIVRHTR